MRRVDLTKRELDTKAMVRKVAPDPSHYSQVIDEPCVLYVDGALAGFYGVLPEEEVAPLRQAVQQIHYQDTYRTGGLKTTSRVIGFQPRVTIRRDFCTAAALANEAPLQHAQLCSGAAIATRYLRNHCPDQLARQEAILRERVKPEWVLPDAAYTSGICNWNNQLRYHFDQGNFEGTWNAMLTFKKDIEGGYLAVPELDVALAVRDGTLSVFNAQGLMHGVTPFKKLSPRAYRYTVVYYALSGMCQCGSRAQELERIRTVKAQREQKRVRVQEGT